MGKRSNTILFMNHGRLYNIVREAFWCQIFRPVFYFKNVKICTTLKVLFKVMNIILAIFQLKKLFNLPFNNLSINDGLLKKSPPYSLAETCSVAKFKTVNYLKRNFGRKVERFKMCLWRKFFMEFTFKRWAKQQNFHTRRAISLLTRF